MARGALPGQRRGGRAKGTLNKRTDEQLRATQESGLTPLEYMLQVLRDPTTPMGQRLDAATRAAPYVHPRLAASTLEINPGSVPVRELTDDQLNALIDRQLEEEAAKDGRSVDELLGSRSLPSQAASK